MNYYALKAMFSSEELEKVTHQLAVTMRHSKDERQIDLLMREYDRLVIETKCFDAIAQNRLRKGL